MKFCVYGLEFWLYTNRKLNPAPDSSPSLAAKILLKSVASAPSKGAAPRIGALGLAIRLRFSWPALEGKVGNISGALGRGFSSKYGWLSISLAEGRFFGFSESKETRSSLPAPVR